MRLWPFISIPLLLWTGCMGPIASWELKHDAKIQAADSAKLKAATDQLEASYQSQMKASDAVIANLQDEIASSAKPRAAQTTYDKAAYQVDTDPAIADTAKVSATTILLEYSLKNGVAISDADFAFMEPIIQGLEAQDAAHQLQAKQALDAKQVALDTAKAAEASQIAQNGVLGAAKAKADAQVLTLSQKVDSVKAQVTKALGEGNAYLAKYSGLKLLIHDILWTAGWVVGIGAVLGILAVAIPPPWDVAFIAASKTYRAVIGGGVKLLVMPFHWAYDLAKKDLEKPATTTAVPKT